MRFQNGRSARHRRTAALVFLTLPLSVGLLAAPVAAPALAAPALAPASHRLTYADALGNAFTAMEKGRHTQALPPLKAALLQDRNDPLSLLALGTLYLHTGSAARASSEFARARELAPEEPLGKVGSALAALAQGRTGDAAALLASLPEGALPGTLLTTLRDYVRVVSGEAAAVRAATAEVTEGEPDALRLEVAGFAALRGGDPARGEALLTALLARPAMGPLVEERALLLPFEKSFAVQGGAPGLPSAIEFPQPPAGGVSVSGRVTLSPPADIPTPSIGYVSYSINEGVFTATTNYAPYSSTWNSARVPNGLYTLRTVVYDRMQQPFRETSRTLRVFNEDAPKTRDHLTEGQREELRARLTELLTPRACRKAAHFALAERAAARGDSAGALAHIECVVAIDPTFQNARGSLRQYHTQAAGPYNGMWKGATKEKIVALTFDDGPNPAPNRTPALLSALKAANAPATFFVVGLRAEENPDLLRRMTADGHEVANHSYSHPNLTFLTTTALERELCRTSVVIRQATGKRPRFYRPPGGNFNSAVVEAARTMGMAGAYWTVDAIKYESTAHTPDRLTRYVLGTVEPGCIVLLHNAPDNTVAAVGDIVRGLRAKGYTLVTMSELVRRSRPVLKGAAGPRDKAKYYTP